MIINKNILEKLKAEYGDAFYLLDSEQFAKNFSEFVQNQLHTEAVQDGE